MRFELFVTEYCTVTVLSLTITGHAALSPDWVLTVGRGAAPSLTLDGALLTNAHSTWV